MKSVWTMVAVGLATLAIFSRGVPPGTEVPTGEKILRIRGRDQAMKILREEESRHPGFSFELVESGMMSRAGPRYSLIAKKKESSAVVKKD